MKTKEEQTRQDREIRHKSNGEACDANPSLKKRKKNDAIKERSKTMDHLLK